MLLLGRGRNNNERDTQQRQDFDMRQKKTRTVNFNYAFTNARSLAPKMGSFIDTFTELDLAFAVVTESWLRDGKELRKQSMTWREVPQWV